MSETTLEVTVLFKWHTSFFFTFEVFSNSLNSRTSRKRPPKDRSGFSGRFEESHLAGPTEKKSRHIYTLILAKNLLHAISKLRIRVIEPFFVYILSSVILVHTAKTRDHTMR